MKKAILVFPIILSLTGCDILRTDESVMAEKIQQLGDYIKDRDVDKIYDVFSVETKEAVPSLKDDILDLFDFFKGTIQYVDDLHIYTDCRTSYGSYTYKRIGSKETEIYTDEARYHFSFSYLDVDADNPGSVGFYYMHFDEFVGIKKQTFFDYERKGLTMRKYDGKA